MICVSIACGSHKRMISELAGLAEEGIRLVELRLDFLRKMPDLGRLLPNRKVPVIVTVRRKQDGGLWSYDEEKRMVLLRTAIISGADYVDIESDIAAKIPRYGKTKRVISYHNFEKTPSDLDALRDEILKTADPDIIKIAVTPKSVGDLFRLFDFMKRANAPGTPKPTVVVGMGELGMPTRILGKKYGIPFTYATFSQQRIVAPGILYYKTLRDGYRYESINAETEVYGVIADPIAHSLSPLIHNAAFANAKLNKVYIPFRVPSGEAAEFIEKAPGIDVRGLSVTIPHKSAVIPKLTRLDPAVEEIDACNTILFRSDAVFGYNTDYLASALCIETAMGGAQGDSSPIAGKQILILGAGGAGKAVAYGLIKKGGRVTIADRTVEKAEKAASQLGCSYCDWDARKSYVTNIIANCTSVGMYPDVDQTPIGPESIRNGMYVFDAVYNPEQTYLLRLAKQKGATPISGLEMFIGQACLQFRLFTGEKTSASMIRALLKEALAMSKS
ncbi:MAG: shikimate dehydrogenase [Thermoguttaceae bacterium]|nr:shikimate dehydrogenase [Thermoguttaceae bacterium]